jgi:hypothetical protein
MIEYNKVNNNLIHLLIKLLRFLNKIILKDYYIDLQKEIKNKIISNLFDPSNLLLEETIYKNYIHDIFKFIKQYFI